MKDELAVIMPDGSFAVLPRGASHLDKTEGWPWRGPTLQRQYVMWRGSDGWKLSKKHQAIVQTELRRLNDEIATAGWEINCSLYVRRGTIGMPAIAKFDIFVNGTSSGYTLVPGQTFWTVPDKDKRWYDLRIFADEIDSKKKTPGDCVRAVMERLPGHVTDLIAHFKTYDPIVHT